LVRKQQHEKPPRVLRVEPHVAIVCLLREVQPPRQLAPVPVPFRVVVPLLELCSARGDGVHEFSPRTKTQARYTERCIEFRASRGDGTRGFHPSRTHLVRCLHHAPVRRDQLLVQEAAHPLIALIVR